MTTIHNHEKPFSAKVGGPHSRFAAPQTGRVHVAGFGKVVGSAIAPQTTPWAVLLVDHAPADLQRHWRMLAEQFRSDVRMTVAHTAAEGLAILAQEAIDVVVSEYLLPDADGLGLLASITALYPRVSTILLTGQGSAQVAAKAIQLGARDYLVKDQLDAATLGRSIRRATRLAESDRRQAHQVEQLHQSRIDLDEVVRALSHDMTANFMLLDHSFRRLKDSTVADQGPIAGNAAAPQGALGDLSQRFAHVEACLKESKRFLDDLVMLARTGGIEMDPSRVELNSIVQEVLFEQRELLTERGIQTTISADLPAVWCNPARVKQVFTNLIRNAAKHGCGKQQPRISIGLWLRTEDSAVRTAGKMDELSPALPLTPSPSPARGEESQSMPNPSFAKSEGSQFPIVPRSERSLSPSPLTGEGRGEGDGLPSDVQFTAGTSSTRKVANSADGISAIWLAVCDNGPGIPAEFRDEIFLPRRRLRGAHPDGSGVGLSIVKRIVEYYGGRVYVDPRYEKGAAFVFSLPALPAA
jgi:signal transduction histidine kinase